MSFNLYSDTATSGRCNYKDEPEKFDNVMTNTLYWVTPNNPAYNNQTILCKPIKGFGGHMLWKNMQSRENNYVSAASWLKA